MFVIVGVLGILGILSSIFWVAGVFAWIGGAVGGLLLLLTIAQIVPAIRTPKRYKGK
jgi:hypothetical protein